MWMRSRRSSTRGVSSLSPLAVDVRADRYVADARVTAGASGVASLAGAAARTGQAARRPRPACLARCQSVRNKIRCAENVSGPRFRFCISASTAGLTVALPGNAHGTAVRCHTIARMIRPVE
jgi:hypothetical protein